MFTAWTASQLTPQPSSRGCTRFPPHQNIAEAAVATSTVKFRHRSTHFVTTVLLFCFLMSGGCFRCGLRNICVTVEENSVTTDTFATTTRRPTTREHEGAASTLPRLTRHRPDHHSRHACHRHLSRPFLLMLHRVSANPTPSCSQKQRLDTDAIAVTRFKVCA